MSSSTDIELRKIFVGGLKADTQDDDFRNFFARYGHIEDCVHIRHKDTKQSKCFGFVTYSKMEEVDKCLEDKPHCINGKEVDVKRAVPKDQPQERSQKIFVGGLPETDEKGLKEFFEKFGKVTQCQFKRDQATGRGRGFGFVQFEDYDTVDKLVIMKYVNFKNKQVECKKALDLKDKQTTPSNGGNPQPQNNPTVYNSAPPPQPSPYPTYPMYPGYSPAPGYPGSYPPPGGYHGYPVPPQPAPGMPQQAPPYPQPAPHVPYGYPMPQSGYPVPQPYPMAPQHGQPSPYPYPAQQQAPSSYGAQKNTYTSHTYNSSRTANYKPY